MNWINNLENDFDIDSLYILLTITNILKSYSSNL